jgi:hypothetical protein
MNPRVRNWKSSSSLFVSTVSQLFKTFRKGQLASLIPFVLVLIVLAAVLFIMSFSSPLAPFVYSLF